MIPPSRAHHAAAVLCSGGIRLGRVVIVRSALLLLLLIQFENSSALGALEVSIEESIICLRRGSSVCADAARANTVEMVNSLQLLSPLFGRLVTGDVADHKLLVRRHRIKCFENKVDAPPLAIAVWETAVIEERGCWVDSYT